MKARICSAFTLIEMLTVLVIIGVLMGLILGAANGVKQKGYRAKATTEIAALSASCENYKADNGSYPRDTTTDALDPRKTGKPDDGKAASKMLYRLLSGDDLTSTTTAAYPPAMTGGVVNKAYFEFKLEILAGNKSSGKLTAVDYIQDPWGYSYGYSTAGAKEEEDFVSGTAKTGKGYNPTFDLWSTGGSVSATTVPTTAEQAKWIKNW